jgi:hypothetical protein
MRGLALAIGAVIAAMPMVMQELEKRYQPAAGSSGGGAASLGLLSRIPLKPARR